MKDMVYKIALRKREHERDFFWKASEYEFKVLDFRVSSRYWMADPFLYERNGEIYVFYEMWDFFRGRGVIAYSKINEDFSVTKPKIVINERYHLSFPNIFDWEGETYIIPESCGNNCVQLYRCVDFPDVWENCGMLVQSLYACDSVLMRDKNNLFLHTNVIAKNNCGHVPSCFVESIMYPVLIPDSSKKEFGELEAVSCSVGDYGIRNAGSPFYYGESLYRVGQDCRGGKYGGGICIFKVDSVKPYKESFVKAVSSDDMAEHVVNAKDKFFYGFHTYNISSKYEVIDLYSYERIPVFYSIIRFFYRCVRFALSFLRRVA